MDRFIDIFRERLPLRLGGDAKISLVPIKSTQFLVPELQRAKPGREAIVVSSYEKPSVEATVYAAGLYRVYCSAPQTALLEFTRTIYHIEQKWIDDEFVLAEKKIKSNGHGNGNGNGARLRQLTWTSVNTRSAGAYLESLGIGSSFDLTFPDSQWQRFPKIAGSDVPRGSFDTGQTLGPRAIPDSTYHSGYTDHSHRSKYHQNRHLTHGQEGSG
jgi:hypothetical protein